MNDDGVENGTIENDAKNTEYQLRLNEKIRKQDTSKKNTFNTSTNIISLRSWK